MKRVAALLFSTALGISVQAAPQLLVHEWGTFTCLQDENGKAIGGINTDDEPVPAFVHNAAPDLLIPEDGANTKSVARCHEQVTMRLETPVVYFYPNEEFSSHLNVDVWFRGGWLTQFFPDATVDAFGLRADGTGLVGMGAGQLRWNGLTLSGSNEGPATNALVWKTPREVDAATIEISGEHEKFLFYRGVGRVAAPVRVVRKEQELIMTRDPLGEQADEINQLWLVDIRDDGTAAFRIVEPFTKETAFLVRTSASFAPEEYSTDTIKNLKAAMRQALLDAGLFEKEADAMLNTWQASYFQSPGLRLFFLVPRRWTDSTLPLRISEQRSHPAQPPTFEAQVIRVMIGRIEIISPDQRELLAKVAASSSDMSEEQWKHVFEIYRRLGRFRNALVLDEQKRNPGSGIDSFIERFRLQGYHPKPSDFNRIPRLHSAPPHLG
jgi:hypothetical protein